MHWLRAILREIFGLFVDDGSFALSILAWLCVVWLLLYRPFVSPRWTGLILFLGLALILLGSTTRYARRVHTLRRR